MDSKSEVICQAGNFRNQNGKINTVSKAVDIKKVGGAETKVAGRREISAGTRYAVSKS